MAQAISIQATADSMKGRRAHRPKLDPNTPPPRVTRSMAADVILAKLGMQVSPRTLEAWPLPTRLANGRATYDTEELLAFARSKLEAAPDVRGGKRSA